MSRDLNYRVWDKKKKEYSDSAFSLDQYGILYIQDEDGYWEEASEDRYIIEFPTGLKDKNGKEIYEGDILQIDDHILGDFEVIWHGFGWKIKRSVGYESLSVHKPEDCTIIGNIHEPPKDFRPEHLKRMGLTVEKGGE